MIGWILENPSLIQLNPEMAPMVFNSALCFVAFSLGFLFSESKNKIVTKGMMLFVGLLATVTLIQYFLPVDLGVDSLFVKPFYTVGVSSPGRMSVSTAICFMLMSVMMYLKNPRYTSQIFIISVSSLVIGVSLTGIFSYVLGFNSEYGWGSFSRMAIHASSSFLLLAVAIVWQLRQQIYKTTRRKGALVPHYVVIVGILTSVLIWQLLVFRDQERNKGITQIRGESLRANLDNAFTPLEKAMEHMARRFASGAYPTQEMWIVDAESYFEEFDGLRRLLWYDSQDVVRWVYPLRNGGEKMVNLTLSEHNKEARRVYERARTERQAFMSKIFELKSGGKGFVMMVPIFKKDQMIGSISAALVAEPFFNRVIHLDGYDLTILEDDREVYAEGAADPVFARDWRATLHYSNLGVNWDIILVPTAATVRENTSALPGVVLLFGVSVSVLLGVAMNFYWRSRESEYEAKEAKELKDASMNSAPLLFISLDENVLIREMNATAEKLLEYTTEEVAGKTMPVIFHDLNEVREIQEQMEKVIGQPLPVGPRYVEAFFKLGYNRASEWTLISKSGKRYSMILSLSEIRDETGKITGYLEILEDVTQLKEKEKRLKEQEAKILASSRLASLGEMAAGIAHEVNNPLAIINGHVGVLRKMLSQKGLDHDSEVLKKVDSIESVVHRIAKIIRGLRSYARESDLSSEEWVSVEALVEDTLTFCYEKFRTEGVELVSTLEPQLEIRVRAYQISQVLLNLLNNAFDAVMISKTVKKITIEAQKRNGGIEISVSDTGPGVPYHLRAKIMEPFFTTKEVGKGVGLGLSISQGIIQSHNGKFYLDESSAKTKFVIWLPLLEEKTKGSKPIQP